ncbi:hypothetical protein GWI33_018087 [Rhynchophorus ferrugineus]|uniref:Uncharacterized protein n=1 Tax=Rhynchophorus ferrugineus TaxID=354439 RepID=A0A834I0T5_RHYFE|nr:hypothetical protein GWI33_018087 [Rhynchophorus ferrugineus]
MSLYTVVVLTCCVLNHLNGQKSNQQWELRPDIARDQRGNTGSHVILEKHGQNHDVRGEWKQHISGPQRGGDRTWVGLSGSIKF